ncbi:hypothetical protein DSLASN_13790 [Desulfoluna limicola]|uniref:SCP2 domain-containing protein n=1 Tax=Desulfoluna limicola TaxID=2810562 RepID=A0ABM7PF02_9BACT|nr:SCP2 sterol-binding domain-containing protein [Desulfoluna limicola]BCS95747.1 hypothetical protein DSLASN_13790 [Desulfoluna limicola]
MPFENADELYDLFKVCLEKTLQDETLANALGAGNMTVGLEIPDLDAFITMELKGGVNVEFGPPTKTLDVTAINNKAIFNKFWQGKLNLMMAMTKGQVKTKGAKTKMLKLLPKITPVYKLYVEALKEVGREDLIVK